MPGLASDRGSDDPVRNGKAVETIAAEIGRIHALHHGRRPAAARAIWEEDLVVCVLEGVFTAAEARRVAAGEFEPVRAERLVRREAIEPLCASAVASATGRPVLAQMTEVAAEGVAFEAFVLG